MRSHPHKNIVLLSTIWWDAKNECTSLARNNRAFTTTMNSNKMKGEINNYAMKVTFLFLKSWKLGRINDSSWLSINQNCPLGILLSFIWVKTMFPSAFSCKLPFFITVFLEFNKVFKKSLFLFSSSFMFISTLLLKEHAHL